MKFNTGKHTSKGPLDYAYSNLWGSTKSLGNCQYFMSAIDDYSKKLWVHFLKGKNEPSEKFNDWRIMVDNQIERKIKKLRTENGLKFCYSQFDLMCKENGIVRQRKLTKFGRLCTCQR